MEKIEHPKPGMKALKGFWQFLNTNVKDIPWGDVAEQGIEAIKSLPDAAEFWQTNANKIQQIAPYAQMAEPLLKALDDPIAQLAIAGLPFVSIGVKLLKIGLDLAKVDPTFESSVAIVAQLAYLQSLEAVLERLQNEEVTAKLAQLSLKDVVERQLSRLDTTELTTAQAKQVTTQFQESVLAQQFEAALTEQLQQVGLEDQQIWRLVDQVLWESHRYFHQAIAEAGESVEPLAEFYRTVGQKEQERYASIDEYLKAQIAPLPLEEVFDESNPKVRFQDIYVQLEVQPLTQEGTVKHDVKPMCSHEWTRQILEQPADQSRKVMFIEGEAGRGKSVFCRMIANWVRAEFGDAFIPLRIRLRDVRKLANNLTETLEDSPDLEQVRFVRQSADWLESQNTRFLIILDGFDELLLEGRATGGLKEFLQQVTDFQRRSHHQLLVTGRPLALQGIERLITQNKGLDRVRLNPMGDEVRERWLIKWQAIFGEETGNTLRQFLNACPKDIADILAREPLQMYLLARLNREGDLTYEMFTSTQPGVNQEIQTKLRIYQVSVNWVLEKQRQDENLRLSGLNDLDDLREVLQEAALCVVQSGNETARLSMVRQRLRDRSNPIADLLKQAQETTGQSEDRALNNLLTTFYLKPGEGDKEGSVEFASKSFSEYLFAERLLTVLEDWTEVDKRNRFRLNDQAFHQQVYDVLGYGGLNREIVAYVFELLQERHIDLNLLYIRLHDFYQRWILNEFLDTPPGENLPQRKMLLLNEQKISASLRRVDAYAGLNIMVFLILFSRCNKAISFHPYGEPFSDEFEAELFLDITSRVPEFIRFIGPFLEGINLSYADLSRVDFNSVNLINSNLSNAILDGANLAQANLTNVNLSKASMRRANVEFADLSSSDLSEVSAQNSNFDQAIFNNANLSRSNLQNSTFFLSNFQNTILRQANLVNAYLDNVDLTLSIGLAEAELIAVNIVSSNLQHINLERSNLADAILRKSNFRGAKLRDTNLARVDLDGAILEEADLFAANLEFTNLHRANLENADLRRAILTGSRVIDTTLTRTILTGACVLDWQINNTTNLEDAICEYIFLGRDEAERRPSNASRNFKCGEFVALVKNYVETIDLFYQGGINWGAFFESFRELQQKHEGENLCLQGIERKGESFVIHLEVNKTANKSLIEQDAESLYSAKLALIEAKHKADINSLIATHKTEIAEIYKTQSLVYLQQSSDITRSVNQIAEAFSKPVNLNVEVSPIMNQSQPNRTIFSDSYREINQHDQSTYVEGNYNNFANQQSLAAAAAEIQELLEQLEKNYGVNTTSGKMQIATEAAKQIEADPSKMQRILSALQAGSLSAFEQLLNHPAASFFIAAAQDWVQSGQQPE